MSSPKRPPRSSSVDGESRSPPRMTAARTSSNPGAVGGPDESEAIQVAIRLRPLNNNESALSTVWKVLPKYNSIAQTTREGKPMPESVQGKNFFTYDKVFGEASSTKEVYDSVAKGIVGSACKGLHGTIFAYGQTSSGKTFTMQGSGTIEEGAQGGGGIVHMAASEIFSYIAGTVEREFSVRASFLEIYNEEVRDLLSNDSRVLQIREDPMKGVFVEAEEKPVHDFETLLNILFQGDKSRKFAQTSMNERSSRSHTIFRITIESKQASGENSASDGAIQVSTLNLVDLAGSESVRHTGATGDRQVEGGMINRSLLTLSRVIVSLGNQGQSHINFRDSKLTRLLQPSLSGNARMAVICCATPSELYLEETRSTLAFASRAKLVKTNAQVNEVISDQTRIRRLVRENAALKHALAERTQVQGVSTDENVSDGLKMKRVANVLLQAGPDIFDSSFSAGSKRRRHSYAAESHTGTCSTPLHSCPSNPPFTESKSGINLNSEATLLFRDEIVSAKTSIIGDQTRKYQNLINVRDEEIQRLRMERKVLQQEKSQAEMDVAEANGHLLTAKRDLDHSRLQNEKLEQKVGLMVEEVEKAEEKALEDEAKVNSLVEAHNRHMTDAQNELSANKIQIDQLQERVEVLHNDLEDNKSSSSTQLKESEDHRLQLTAELDQKRALITKLQNSIAVADETIADHLEKIVRTEEINQELDCRVVELKDQVEREKNRSKELNGLLAAEKIKVQTIMDKEGLQEGKMEELANENSRLRLETTEKSQEIKDLLNKCNDLQRDYTHSMRQGEAALAEARHQNERLSRRYATLECVLCFVSNNASALQEANCIMQSEVDSYQLKSTEIAAELVEAKAAYSKLSSTLELCEAKSAKQLEAISVLESQTVNLLGDFEDLRQARDTLAAEIASKENVLQETTDRLNEQEKQSSHLLESLESVSSERDDLKAALKVEEHQVAQVRRDADEKLASLQQEKVSLEASLAEATNKFNAAQETIEDLHGSMIKSVEAKSAKQLEAISVLESQTVNLLGDIEDLHQARDTLAAEIASKENVLRATTDRLNEQEKQSSHLLESLESVSNERDDLKAALKVEELQVAQVRRDAEEKLASLQLEKVALEASLAEATNKFNAAQESIEDLHASMIKSVESEKRLAKEVTHLQSLVESRNTEATLELQKRLEMATKANSEIVVEAEAKMKQLRNELALANDAKASIEKEAYVCRQMTEELQDQVDALEADRVALTTKSLELEQTMSVLQNDLKVMKSELVVAQDHSKTLQRNTENERLFHQKELLRLQQVNQKLKTASQSTNYGSLRDVDSEKKKLASENAEFKLLLEEKDKRIQKLSKSKLTERHIETMKQYKTENESFKAEIEFLKSQLAATKTSSTALVKSNVDLVPTQQCDLSTLQELQFAKQATETKYSKLKTDYQDLQSERRQAVEALKSSIIGQSLFGSNGVDLTQAITVLCDKVTSSDTTSAQSFHEDETRNSLASAEAAKVDLQMKLNKAMKQDAEKAQLLDVKDRELGFLQKENLHLMNRLKEARKERDEFKTRNNALHKQARTVGYGSQPPTSAAKFKADPTISSVKSPRRPPSKSAAKITGTDKENSVEVSKQTPTRSSSKRHSSAIKTHSKKKSKHIEEELHAAFGGPCDEHTENCKQS